MLITMGIGWRFAEKRNAQQTGGGSQVANRSRAVVHLPAGPHVSSLCSEPDEMGMGISQLEINPFLPVRARSRKRKSKYLVQADPSRLLVLVRGSGVAV